MISVVNKYKHQKTESDFYIGRGSALGNPFTSIKTKETKALVVCENREESISRFKEYLKEKIQNKDEKICFELNRIYKMAKKGDVNLICYCAPKACHGDVIKEIIEEKLK